MGLASLALAAMAPAAGGIESTECPAHEPRVGHRQGFLTIGALHTFNKPIHRRCVDLARGRTYPFAKPQLLPNGRVNNRPIKNWRGEVVYFRCCWPRYTRHEYLYERAVLVR